MNRPLRTREPSAEKGFTLIEIIVTLAVVSVFIFGIIQIFILLDSQRMNVARQAKSSDLAYSYLRNYNTRPADPANPSLLLPCRTTDQTLVSNRDVTSEVGGGAARLTITASAPEGCSGTDFAKGVIKIEAVITYNGNREVRHATYINQ